jgi:flagellar basal-body rod modification protein FlgD
MSSSENTVFLENPNMPTNPITGTSTQNSGSSQGTRDRMQDLDVEEFLKLMIAELQNQDPLNPMDNAQMIQQISEIRSISSTDKLTDTLDSVQLGQALASASGLIGRNVTGLSEKNTEVNGKVDRVSVVDGVPKLHVGANALQLKNVREIIPTT